MIKLITAVIIATLTASSAALSHQEEQVYPVESNGPFQTAVVTASSTNHSVVFITSTRYITLPPTPSPSAKVEETSYVTVIQYVTAVPPSQAKPSDWQQPQKPVTTPRLPNPWQGNYSTVSHKSTCSSPTGSGTLLTTTTNARSSVSSSTLQPSPTTSMFSKPLQPSSTAVVIVPIQPSSTAVVVVPIKPSSTAVVVQPVKPPTATKSDTHSHDHAQVDDPEPHTRNIIQPRDAAEKKLLHLALLNKHLKRAPEFEQLHPTHKVSPSKPPTRTPTPTPAPKTLTSRPGSPSAAKPTPSSAKLTTSPKPSPPSSTRTGSLAPTAVETRVVFAGPHCPYPYPGEHCGSAYTTLVTETKTRETESKKGAEETGWCPYPGQTC